ncbi:MAG: DUF4150 domain-containing protein, partial [Polyangiaceae bacterium]|nr:DUF4150 domain-containing protein [Polyangiaceae bacterium]
MTKRTVLNKGRFVSTKGTGDWACATEPDMCETPTVPKGKPFNNKIGSEKLQGGTEKTTIAGESIWIKAAKLGPTSLPPHEGVKGVNSQKPAHGPAWAVTASQNLFAEGEPVVRLEDKTLQNWGNAHGEVMKDPKDLALADQSGGGGGGRADGDSDNTRKKGAKDAEGGRGNPNFPKSGELPVPECEIIAVQAYCDHANRWSKDGLLQVVVTGMRPHLVRLEAAVNGPCEKVTTHTHWSVLDGPTLPQGRLSVLEAMRPEPKLLSLQAFDTLLMRNKKEYKLRCDSCKASNQTLEVEAYEPGTVVFTDAPIREWLRGELWKASIILGFFVGEAKVGHKPDDEVEMFEVLKPAGGRKDAIVGSMRVKEFTDHRAFVSIGVEFHAAPLFRFGFRISLVELVIDILMAVFTGGGGNLAKAGAKGGAKLALRNFIPELAARSPAVVRRVGTRVIRSGSELFGKYAPQ